MTCDTSFKKVVCHTHRWWIQATIIYHREEKAIRYSCWGAEAMVLGMQLLSIPLKTLPSFPAQRATCLEGRGAMLRLFAAKKHLTTTSDTHNISARSTRLFSAELSARMPFPHGTSPDLQPNMSHYRLVHLSSSLFSGQNISRSAKRAFAYSLHFFPSLPWARGGRLRLSCEPCATSDTYLPRNAGVWMAPERRWSCDTLPFASCARWSSDSWRLWISRPS